MTRVVSGSLHGRDSVLELTRPCLMGVLNVTPDSFSDGGRFYAPEQALQRGLELQRQGADLLDIGGESTRPGAEAVSADEELARVIPVIEQFRKQSDLPISIDTSKAIVAREALLAGANFINDISGLSFDSQMATVAAETGAGLFLMHTRGRPTEMQRDTGYQDLFAEVYSSLQHSIKLACAAGVQRNRLAVDPGIGFGKSALGCLELLHNLDRFHRLGCPILLGTSRKSFIGKLLQQVNPDERLTGSLATVALAVAQRVQIFRVHDVQPTRDTALLAWAIRERQLP